ncbi:MAG: DUF3810 domain-containing protein [Blastocatellia bacterium]|nr:DUF3810 domain-containing protein [Blastocatellia bacterium]
MKRHISTFKKNFLANKRLRWKVSLGLFLLVYTIQSIASKCPDAVEIHYSRTIYPYIIQTLSLFNRLFFFSLAELVVALTATLITIVIARDIVWISKGRVSYKEFLSCRLLNLSELLATSFLIFLLIWGLNYARRPLSDNLALKKRQMSEKQLEQLCRFLIDQVNRNYCQPPTEFDSKKMADIYHKIELSYQQNPELIPLSKVEYGQPKPIISSHIFTLLGISGIYSPFTGEPNFNREQPASELPFSIAHEKAHQRGFALEDEANFIAFLVCIKSSDAYIRYCGYLMAMRHILATFYLIDPEKYKEVVKLIEIGPKEDLRESTAFWNQHHSQLTELSEAINNSYLKANRVKSGIDNYDEVVQLLISYYANTFPNNF